MADARLRAGLTQANAAEYMGVCSKTIGQWEVGLRAPPIADACRLAGLYSISVGELFGSALDRWVPPTLKLAEVERSVLRRPINRRKSHGKKLETVGRVRNRGRAAGG